MKKSFKKLFSLSLALLLTFSIASPASAASKPAKVTALQAYSIDDDELNLKWKKASGAYVYQVYTYSSGKWRYVDGTKRLRLEIEDLASAKVYKFKVRAYKFSGGKKVYGPFSKVLTVATKPEEVDDVRASATKNSVTLKWSKENRVTGYQVYAYSQSKGKYVKEKSVRDATSVTLSNLKENTRYKFKVRAYLKDNGKVYYGEFSDAVSVKTKAADVVQPVEPAQPPVQAEKVTSPVAEPVSQTDEYIGRENALLVALKHAGFEKSDVRDLGCELDNERGVIVYEVDFDHGKFEYSYEIDAVSGKILHVEKEVD